MIMSKSGSILKSGLQTGFSADGKSSSGKTVTIKYDYDKWKPEKPKEWSGTQASLRRFDTAKSFWSKETSGVD